MMHAVRVDATGAFDQRYADEALVPKHVAIRTPEDEAVAGGSAIAARSGLHGRASLVGWRHLVHM